MRIGERRGGQRLGRLGRRRSMKRSRRDPCRVREGLRVRYKVFPLSLV